MQEDKSWQSKTLIIGGLLGLFSGLFAAYLLIQRSKEREDHPDLSAGDGVKVGLGVLGVLKLISDIGESKS